MICVILALSGLLSTSTRLAETSTRLTSPQYACRMQENQMHHPKPGRRDSEEVGGQEGANQMRTRPQHTVDILRSSYKDDFYANGIGCETFRYGWAMEG